MIWIQDKHQRVRQHQEIDHSERERCPLQPNLIRHNGNRCAFNDISKNCTEINKSGWQIYLVAMTPCTDEGAEQFCMKHCVVASCLHHQQFIFSCVLSHLVQPKSKMLSLLTHPQFVPFQYEFISAVLIKRINSEENASCIFSKKSSSCMQLQLKRTERCFQVSKKTQKQR